MYENYVTPEKALGLLSTGNYGASVFQPDYVCLSPVIINPSKLRMEDIENVSRGVNIHNRPVVVADSMLPGMQERIYWLKEGYRGELEEMLHFVIPVVKSEAELSPKEREELGLNIE